MKWGRLQGQTIHFMHSNLCLCSLNLLFYWNRTFRFARLSLFENFLKCQKLELNFTKIKQWCVLFFVDISFKNKSFFSWIIPKSITKHKSGKRGFYTFPLCINMAKAAFIATYKFILRWGVLFIASSQASNFLTSWRVFICVFQYFSLPL